MSESIVEESAEVTEVLPLLPAVPSSITVSRELIVEPPAVVQAEEAILIPAIPTLAAPSVKFEVVEAPVVEEEPVVEEATGCREEPVVEEEQVVEEAGCRFDEPVVEEEPVSTAGDKAGAAAPAPRPALASSADQAKRSGSIGVEMGYEFTFDGTGSDRMNHRLWAKPYFSRAPSPSDSAPSLRPRTSPPSPTQSSCAAGTVDGRVHLHPHRPPEDRL